MYNVAALEKGLVRNRDIRLGFSKKALTNLNDALVIYRLRDYDHVCLRLRRGAVGDPARHRAARLKEPRIGSG
jgi:hypothetical protein